MKSLPTGFLLKILLVNLITLVALHSALAQPTGSVRGKAYAKNLMPVVCEKAPCEARPMVPLSGITVELCKKKMAIATKTDKKGRFVFKNLLRGVYTLKAEKINWTKKIKVRGGKPTRVEIVREVH